VAQSLGVPEQIQRQIGLASVGLSGLWDAGLFTPLWIVGPGRRKVEALVHDQTPVGTDISQKNTDLAVGDFADRAAILPRDARRLLALLHDPALIHRPDPFRMGQTRTDFFLQSVGNGSVFPERFREEPLQDAGRRLNYFRKVLDILPLFGLEQKGFQVVLAALSALLASKDLRKSRVKGGKAVFDLIPLFVSHGSLQKVLTLLKVSC
jgi:hypothetical protein